GRAQRAADDEDDRRSRRNRGRNRPSARRDEDVRRGGEPAERSEGESPAVEDHGEASPQELAVEDETAIEAEDTEGPTPRHGAPIRRGGDRNTAKKSQKTPRRRG